MRSCPLPRPFFYISLKFLIKILLNKKIIPSLHGSRKASLLFPQKLDPCVNKCPFPGSYLAYFRGHKQRILRARFPSQSSFRGRCPIPSALLHLSFNVHGIRAPFQVPMRMPVSRAFSAYLACVPVMKSPHQVPLAGMR